MVPADNPHLLPERQARRIFEEDIVRELFSGVASHHDDGVRPLAVVVVGQPGAGKSATSSFIQDELAARRGEVAHVVGDFFKPYHPDYNRLLVTEPENASPATSPDARRWIEMSVDYLIRGRMDVLLESAGRDRADFADLAQRFHDHGYRVEVAILAVHESLSRQGILTRYHEGPEKGRLTARATHDQSYTGVLDAADFLDASEAVDAVTVLRRGNRVVYTNARRDGLWQAPPATRRAVEQERARPFPPKVAHQFTATNTRLAAEMPTQWRAELGHIRALAAPLLHGRPLVARPPATAKPADPPKRPPPARPAPRRGR